MALETNFDKKTYGPSPAETDALIWASINEVSRRKFCAGARNLNNFINDAAHPYMTASGDSKTNIIDLGNKRTYAFNNDMKQKLFKYLNAARIDGCVAHFSEKQSNEESAFSGLMLDYDMIIDRKNPNVKEEHFKRISILIAMQLYEDIKNDETINTYVFFITKQEPLPVGDNYKYGIHILIPGIKLSRAYKRSFIQKFATNAAMSKILTSWGVVGDPTTCLDRNSASVPVMFFGSCKLGSIPYKLSSTMEVSLDPSWDGTPIITPVAPAQLEKYNLVAEMSLTTEAEYDNNMPPLVFMKTYEINIELPNTQLQRTSAATIDEEEIIATEHCLSTLTLCNAEARHLHALLDLLTEEYYTSRDKWRNVIFALANTNPQYKPLAIWFSHKCPSKWIEGGLAALDAMWEEALSSKSEKPLTIRSISYWARACDPIRYNETMNRSYFTILMNYVHDHGGKLQHAMISKVLHIMLRSKFCVDNDAGTKYAWYEFVIPDQPMKNGEVWKWRKEVEPGGIQIYISEKLTKVMDQISEHLEEQRINAADEEQAKYYKNIIKSFAGSKLSLYNDTFKRGIINQCIYSFHARGFADQLDRRPDLFGIANGVLKLGAPCALIDYYHEYPVSKFSPVAFARLDPKAPDQWQKLALDAIAAIIIEPDARDWILFHAAQGLSGAPKEGLLLLWEGGGQNGKTSFLRWVAKALGPYADKFNIQLMCCEREDADKPNSAMMRFKHLNYAYSEESNKAQTLNVARMKEMVNAGEVSGRDLNSKQETFTMKANMVAASQYSFIINTTDHGTWRRLRHYTSKTKFRQSPDPNNKFERPDDYRFVCEYPENPNFQSAILSILVWYYERLQTEYGGELKKVPCPTIEGETEAFRIEQDALHRWISRYVVESPSTTFEYLPETLVESYVNWYNHNIQNKKFAPSELIKELESSAIGKYFRPSLMGCSVLKGCRILTADDMTLYSDESVICSFVRREKTCEVVIGDETQWWRGASTK